MPIRGLHSKTLNSLQRAGLLQAFDHEGRPHHASNVVPARLVLVEPKGIGSPMHSTKKVEHTLNTWLDSHGYRHSHANKQKASQRGISAQSGAGSDGGLKGRAAYYVDVNGKIRSTTQPAAPGFTHRLVGDAVLPPTVQVIAADGEVAFEHQPWFDLAALEEAIGQRPVKSGHARIIHQPPTDRPVFAAHERDHHITTSGRRALDREQFALPPGPEEKRRGIAGRLPIDTIARARNALQRASQMEKRGHITAGQLTEVRRMVHRAWPTIAVHRDSVHASMKEDAKAPELRVGQQFDHFGHTYEILKIWRDKNRTVQIARRYRDSFGKEAFIDHRSFPARHFNQQHLKLIGD